MITRLWRVSLTYFDDLDALRGLHGTRLRDRRRGRLRPRDSRPLRRPRQPLRNGVRNLMISRIWHGYTRPGDADSYAALLDR